MKHLKGYKKFKESLVIDLQFQDIDLKESLNIWHDTLLSSIGAEEVNLFDTLFLPKEESVKKMTFIKAAQIILKDNDNEPMSASEICDEISKRELYKTEGQTSKDSLNNLMMTYTKLFKIVGGGPAKFILVNPEEIQDVTEDVINNLDIDFLSDSVEFVNSLTSLKLKKSEAQNTDTIESFVNKPCKFMFIYGIESNELENPIYILFQVWNETQRKWSDVKLYKIKEDVKKFYDKLSSKEIEIIDGDEKYIYVTSNGNDWLLKDEDKETDTYKKSLRKEELEKLLSERNVKISIV